MAYTLMDKEYDRTLTKRGMAAFFSHIVAGNKKMGVTERLGDMYSFGEARKLESGGFYDREIHFSGR